MVTFSKKNPVDIERLTWHQWYIHLSKVYSVYITTDTDFINVVTARLLQRHTIVICR